MTLHTEYEVKRPARMLSVNELAGYLGISRAGIYRIVRRGELDPIRVGNRFRFRREDVDDYLERNRATGTAP